MKLTVKQIVSAKPKDKNHKLSDGNGLNILIKTSGHKSFIYRYSFEKKQHDLYLGSFPEISLKEARQRRDAFKVKIANGINPIEEKKEIAAQQDWLKKNTFSSIYPQWLESRKEDWTHAYYEDVTSRVDRMVLPLIGNKSLDALEPKDLYAALKTIQDNYSIGLGHKCKQYISGVFSFALVLGLVSRNPVNDLTGLLKANKSNHYPAIVAPKELGKFLRAIDSYTGTTVVIAALKLTPQLLCRPGELRQMKWFHINWDQNRIELPASIMKMSEDHIIPLTQQSKSILRELYRHTGWQDNANYIFPSQRGFSRPLSENGVRVAMRNMGYSKEQVTPHGFRATARTLLDEVLEYPIEIIEQQLAHAVRDVHGRAYNRTKHLKQRADMMQAWADYLDELKVVNQ
jgi:integrase